MVMKKIFFRYWVTAIIVTTIMATPAMAQMAMNSSGVFKTESANTLRTNLRVLWEDHVMYTRNVIFNIIDDLPGTNEAVARLLKNQDDIGNAIKPVYGEAAGNKLTSLLHDHITIAADLLKAAKASKQADFDAVNKKWLQNADDISAFLSSANPKNWPVDDMKKMMHDHLSLTTQEAVARLKKDYKNDIETYDKVKAEILDMSDMLAAGIIKQYPDKFAQ
jgi:hypothetical protein